MLMSVNLAANMSRLRECAVHGPLCSAARKHDPDFPEVVDENLQPISLGDEQRNIRLPRR